MTLRLLFVCGGNTCRSPMAVGLARRILGEVVEAESAGIDPGYSVTGEAVRTMAQEFGIDVSDHKPRSVNTLALDDFDYIVTLDSYVRDYVIERLPYLRDKLVSWHIDDPYGQGMDQYRECARSLEGKLRQFRAGKLSKQ